ncbi:MAG: CHAT domain-containing protein [Alphaproteobacteria bacterium]|nr:CHAT domain-containing protein [Alphaproteobacteria bacterium]
MRQYVALLRQRTEHERQVDRHPQAAALRHEAHPFSVRGEQERAHALFQQAAALFDPEDTSAAAAAAWYDLAESYKRLRSGVRVENLLRARELLERASRSPVRRRCPFRHPLTLDALGQVRRQLAQHSHDDEASTRLLRRATKDMVEACRITDQQGVYGWHWSAQYHNNLGNLLRQRSLHEQDPSLLDDAIRCHERSLVRARKAFAFLELYEQLVPERNVLAQLLVNAANALQQREQGDDVLAARRHLLEALHHCEADFDHLVNLALAASLLRQEPVDETLARQHFRRVHLPRLGEAHRNLYVDLIRVFDGDDAALQTLYGAVQEAMLRRRHTMADHAADHVAWEAQRYAHRIADIHVDHGEHVRAFLAIENTAGMRYFDAVMLGCWTPNEPKARLLHALHHRVMALAALLDDRASRVAMMDDASGRELLRAMEADAREALQEKDDPSMMADLDPAGRRTSLLRLADVFAEAADASDPVNALRQHSQAFVVDSERLRHLKVRRYPESSPSAYNANRKLDSNGLRAALEASPQQAFLRVVVAGELLAIGVWLDDSGELQSASVRAPLGDIESLVEDGGRTAPEVASAAMRRLDISDALPGPSIRRIVLLPSFLANRLPLAAMGPVGSTLLDRFDAVTWLPNLTALRLEPPPHPPRAGMLTLAPVQVSQHRPTRYHALAFSQPLPMEQRRVGSDASIQALQDGVKVADVVSLYTHGVHEGELGPEILLQGGSLDRSILDLRWRGLERVEVWACESGVSRPTDMLTPTVDEAFGLDIELHRVGVRSTIGTLWKVPDFVTGCICRRYRQGLNAGRDAAQALADAQRWWRDEALPEIDALLQEHPQEMALHAFVRTLGVELEEIDLREALGPVPREDAPLSEQQRGSLLALLSSPCAWAGFRLIGVCGRRPTGPWTNEHERAPTEAERAEVMAWVAEADDPAEVEPVDMDIWRDQQLDALREQLGDGAPSPEQAVQAARLYRDRQMGSMAHNLLRGQAWVAEALARPGLVEADRRRLMTESAWLWLELARGEHPIPPLDLPHAARRVHLARLERCLDQVEFVDRPVLEAWSRTLRAGLRGPEAMRAAAREGLQALGDTWPHRPRDPYAALRWMTARVALMSLAQGQTPKGAPESLIRSVVEGISHLDRAFGDQPALVRLHASLNQLGDVLTALAWSVAPSLLTHRERGAETLRTLQRWMRLGVERAEHLGKEFDRWLSQLEGDFWGYPRGDTLEHLLSTGSPGAGWAMPVRAYVFSKSLFNQHDDNAIHVIASLHLGADLRVGMMSALCRLFQLPDMEQLQGLAPHLWLYYRERAMELLADCAGDPDREALVSGANDLPNPSNLDAFRLSAALLRGRSVAQEDMVAWSAGEFVDERPPQIARARTAAFALLRQADHLDTLLRGFAEASLKAEERPNAPQRGFLRPQTSLPELERSLNELPERDAVLALTVGPLGELIGAMVARVEGKLITRLRHTDPGLGWTVRGSLTRTLAPDPTELRELPRRPQQRAQAWEEVVAAMEPLLSQLFEGVDPLMTLRLSVLAPGPLRALPVLGLSLRGQPLAERFGCVRHLPHLGFPEISVVQPLAEIEQARADLLGGPLEALPFGQLAMAGLARLVPPVATLDPATPPTQNIIVESDRLHEVGVRLRALRMYGLGPQGVVRCERGLVLQGGRRLTLNNLRGVELPGCDLVELWADTSTAWCIQDVMAEEPDRIPGLAWDLLASGAKAVLDLAWPVHDLVRALLCEQVGLQRAFGVGYGCAAVREALVSVRRMLQVWSATVNHGGEVRVALGALDELRRTEATRFGVDGAALVPFAEVVVEGTLAELLDAALCPTQLAAVRYWGT